MTSKKLKPKYQCLKCGKNSYDSFNYNWLVYLHNGGRESMYEYDGSILLRPNGRYYKLITICKKCSKSTTVIELLKEG